MTHSNRRAVTLCLLALMMISSGLGTASAQERASRLAFVRGNDWHVREPGGTKAFIYGRPGDHVLFGDWDGDGVPTPGVYRSGYWHLRNANAPGSADITFYYGGQSGDIPITGDWNGDGVDTAGIVRDGTWHLVQSHRGGSADISFHYGRVDEGDVPLAGDWDLDGTDTAGIVRDGAWHLVNFHRGGRADVSFVYGRVLSGDVPVAGDWNGDGRDTPGVVREGVWYLRNEVAGGTADAAVRHGVLGDRMVVQGGTSDYGSVWYRLAYCESRLNWWINSRFDGGLQFHPSTWRSYKYDGFSAYAYQAPPEHEIAVARRVLRAQGWEAWPSCTRKLGLR